MKTSVESESDRQRYIERESYRERESASERDRERERERQKEGERWRESDIENDTFVSLHLSAAVPPRDWIAIRHRGPRELFKLAVFVVAGLPAGFFLLFALWGHGSR